MNRWRGSRWWPTKEPVLWALGLAVVATLMLVVLRVLVVFWGFRPGLFQGTVYYVRYPLLALVAFALLGLLLRAIRLGYSHEWTGFAGSAEPEPDTPGFRPRKLLWDWLELLIVPLVLAAGALLFNWAQDNRQQWLEDRRAESARTIEERRAQDAALQDYLDEMGYLLLEKNLRDSKPDDEVRTLARARTLTILERVDPERKGSILRFLHESDLITKAEGPVVDLGGADLTGSDLSDGNLAGADLSDTRLYGARLRTTNLSGTDLTDANLICADLSWAFLGGARLGDTSLSAADLSHAILWDTELLGTRLSGAVLYRADLSGGVLDAYLAEANLSEANLVGADLSEARGLTQGQVDQAFGSYRGSESEADTERLSRRLQVYFQERYAGDIDLQSRLPLNATELPRGIKKLEAWRKPYEEQVREQRRSERPWNVAAQSQSTAMRDERCSGNSSEMGPRVPIRPQGTRL